MRLLCSIKRHKTRRQYTKTQTGDEKSYYKLTHAAHIMLQAANIRL